MSIDLVYPALYYSSDLGSLAGQRRTRFATKVRLFALFAAAIGGAASLKAGSVDLFGVLGVLGFLVSLGAEGYLLKTDPAQDWYEGRTVNESTKTLTWRYVAGGKPFPPASTAADRELLKRLRAVLDDPGTVPTPVADAPTEEITASMRALRAEPFEQRRESYRTGRLVEQLNWYGVRARANQRLFRQYTAAAVVLELAGLAGGTLKVFDVLDVDLLGVLAAAAAGLTAWMQARNYADNHRTYSFAHHQLALIHAELPTVAEDRWPEFVDDAESAISSEHTHWRASKGLISRR